MKKKPAAGQTAKPVPLAVIKRLPLYYARLASLAEAGILRVSSSHLARLAGVTPAQLRHDLSHFGSFGQQGYGYRTHELQAAIGRILGLDRSTRMVLVGAGHLGRALANYQGFRRRRFFLQAIFDSDPALVGQVVADLTVQEASQLSDYLGHHRIEIGIIAVPAEEAQAVADRLVAGGVKGIWNFAHLRLSVPDDVVVEQVNLTDSLLTLAFRLEERKKA
ncbi:MAG: redox-sensing transcriptional repressor Rex [Pseudomonadota bacterium]